MLPAERNPHREALLWEESLTIRKELGQRRGIAVCLDFLGVVAQEEGRMEQARSFHQQSLAIRLELGDRPGLPSARCRLGQLCYLQGDLEALALYAGQSSERISDVLRAEDIVAQLVRSLPSRFNST